MGCINSKQAAKSFKVSSPPFHHHRAPAPLPDIDNAPAATLDRPSKSHSATKLENEKKLCEEKSENRSENKESSEGGSKSELSHRNVEAEQVSPGWPYWLTHAAGEAVHGWIPLRADSFEKLEKIGHGTYSSVFRARQVETGKIVALKKVRFDNFQPESIRFMAREIMILRRLDHPNIMKLRGLITSKLSTSIYLVFDYMEHDLAGLVSSPDVKFSEAQVKCYMRQLLSAIEHCHLRGIMHRDIKTSNILVNNDGVLKLADFGLANILNSKKKQPLTSRVVTLWYRPPELLMGSTDYGLTVDLWSIGCVFAELHLGKPLFKGRTEVEQLHKIFKLCGSPLDEFWKKTKLPHAAMFKPQIPYESSLNEKCKDFAQSAVSLLETFISIEPSKRGTASSALMSEYFKTKPYACDPSTLPKYPPNKEMDAKNREDARRKRTNNARPKEAGVTTQRPKRVRRNMQELNHNHKVATKEEAEENTQPSRRNNSKEQSTTSEVGAVTEPNPSGDSAFTAPIAESASIGFGLVKKKKDEATSTVSDGRKSQISALDPSFANYITTKRQSNRHMSIAANSVSLTQQQQRKKYDFSKSFDESVTYSFNELNPKPQINAAGMTHFDEDDDTESQIEFELLQRNESQLRPVARKSRFERDR